MSTFDWNGLLASIALIVMLALAAACGFITGYVHVITQSQVYVSTETRTVEFVIDGHEYTHWF